MSSESSESSLTAPEDRDRINRWKPDQSIAPLSSSEFKNAISELKSTDFIKKFPRVERQYADPAISLQNIGLISFVPAKGAKPNENGVFGYAKMRGNYPNELEANERSEFIIRNVDSYNTIFSTYVGRPFPITVLKLYKTAYNEMVDFFHQNNIQDDDQHIVLQLYYKYPNLFSFTGLGWHNVLTKYQIT